MFDRKFLHLPTVQDTWIDFITFSISLSLSILQIEAPQGFSVLQYLRYTLLPVPWLGFDYSKEPWAGMWSCQFDFEFDEPRYVST